MLETRTFHLITMLRVSLVVVDCMLSLRTVIPDIVKDVFNI